MGDGTTRGIERLNRIGRGLGDLKLALGFAQPGAGIRPDAATPGGDEPTHSGELASCRNEGPHQRGAGVSEKQIADHAHVFQNTLGYLDGHVYYQIDNWYEMVKLIPGSAHNQAFFAAMLQPARDGAPRVTPRPGIRGGIILAALGIRLGLLMTRADARSRRFKKTFAARLARYDALG